MGTSNKTRSWDDTRPADSDNIASGANEIRYARVDINERMKEDHYFDSSQDYDGQHKKVSLRDQGSDPSTVAGISFAYAKDNGGTSQPYFKDGDGRIYQLTPADGWLSACETWTYASADSPTFTFTISGDVTTKYQAGQKIKLTQTTVKYFIITKVAYSDPNTTITIYGGTDYTLANAAITANYFSLNKAPFGFPLNPDKWTVSTTNTILREQNPASANIWYNVGSISLTIPIGVWNTSYQVCVSQTADTVSLFVTLSTSNNSESDTSFTSYGASGAYETSFSYTTTRSKILNLTSKTVYYILGKGTYGNRVMFRNNFSPLIIKTVCAYL